MNEQVPVIAVISSYGTQGDESTPINIVSVGRGEFIFENFIPHGYAFAQVAVFRTELSSGCFDYRGVGEIHNAVEWFGSQNWSNTHVGLYGKSYEGATPWEAAALDSKYLKTMFIFQELLQCIHYCTKTVVQKLEAKLCI